MKNTPSTTQINRRKMLRLLGAFGGSIALSACGGSESSSENSSSTPDKSKTPPQPPTRPSDPAPAASALPDGLKREHFIVHNEKPLALESIRAQHTASPITPLEKLFVRNNLPMPSAEIVENADDWVLDLDGNTIDVAELKTLPIAHETSVLQCSGNGRGFFAHSVSGSQWKTGAAGCILWTGVRIKDVLTHLGLKATSDKKYLTATGGDPLPQGVDRDTVIVERSIPIEKGLKDCMLAWEVNGVPIPLTHGGPLRLIVPGYFGCNQIKYVRKIAFTVEQTKAKIQRTGYRFRPIGQKGSPDQPSLWRMPVKSWLVSSQTVRQGWSTFFGYAFSGERGIKQVLYSTDDGKNWTEADLLSPDLGVNAWRSFQFRLNLPLGEHRIVTKAIDKTGEAQPELRVENERGYRHNGWKDHAHIVNVVDTIVESPKSATKTKTTAAPIPETKATTVQLSEAGQRGEQLFTKGTQPNCGVCHTLEHAQTKGAIGPNLNQLQPSIEQVQTAVKHGVGAMPEFSGQLSDAQISDIASYVVEATKK